MLKKSELPVCTVNSVIELIGNKWKILIIKRLQKGSVRFNELGREIPGISQKVLRDNLKALERDFLVERTVFSEIPPHVEYSLTELGKTLKVPFAALMEWETFYRNAIEDKEKNGDFSNGGEQ